MKNIEVPIFMTDFEGSRKIGVVEYGVAEILGGEIISAQTAIFRPRMKIPQRDAEFFGIDNAEAERHEPFENSAKYFCGLRARGVMASHNSSVEDSLLRDILPSPGIVPNFEFGGNLCSWSPWIDTVALVRNLYPDLHSAKLSELIEVFGLTSELESSAQLHCPAGRRKWHCALYDALAAAVLLLSILSQRGFEDTTLPWLIKYSDGANAPKSLL